MGARHRANASCSMRHLSCPAVPMGLAAREPVIAPCRTCVPRQAGARVVCGDGEALAAGGHGQHRGQLVWRGQLGAGPLDAGVPAGASRGQQEGGIARAARAARCCPPAPPPPTASQPSTTATGPRSTAAGPLPAPAIKPLLPLNLPPPLDEGLYGAGGVPPVGLAPQQVAVAQHHGGELGRVVCGGWGRGEEQAAGR